MSGGSKPSVKDRIRYWIDSIISRGVLGLLLLSVLGSALLLVLVVPVLWGLGRALTGQGDFGTFVQQYWAGFVNIFKAGNGEGPWLKQVTTLTFAVISIFFTGTVFGAVIKSINDRVQTLRETGGAIISSDHTVVLGWSSLGPRILQEVSHSRSVDASHHVAVLTPGSKATLEKDLGARKMLTTKIDIRPGKATSMADLDIVRTHSASSVVVLGPWLEGDHDSKVISSLLALARYREKNPEFEANVVACLLDPNNLVPARVAAKYPTSIIDVKKILARMMLQMARQPGLYWVYSNLLSFEGCEFVQMPAAQFAGRRFGELALAFPKDIAAGVIRDGVTNINPGSDTILKADDTLVMISDDRKQPVLGDCTSLARQESIVIDKLLPEQPDSESWLFLNWSDRIPDILVELDRYRQKPTKITLAVSNADADDANQTAAREYADLAVGVETWARRETLRSTLERLHVPDYDYVVMLSPGTQTSRDHETVMRLLHVRDLIDIAMANDPTTTEPAIVTELLQDEYVKLSDSNAARDFVVSSEIVSMLLTDIAEYPWVMNVYDEIFDAEGSEVYLYPAEWYVATGESTNFATIAEAAARRDEVAIGYRSANRAHDASREFGVDLNPVKSLAIDVRPGDCVVVLAQG